MDSKNHSRFLDGLEDTTTEFFRLLSYQSRDLLQGTATTLPGLTLLLYIHEIERMSFWVHGSPPA